MSERLVELAGVGWKARGRRVLQRVNLDVFRGECVAVVGPNGAGKTSLLRILAGLERPTEGAVSLQDVSLSSLSRRRVARRIAYVPQLRPNRIPLTVDQMVMLGRYPHWRRQQIAPTPKDFEAVRQALQRVGLEELSDRRMDRLSGGEQQGIFLAACLAQEAETLVLDEPTTHLDPRHQRDVAGLILDLSREAGRTIVCATHDLNFASLIASRIVALKEGEILLSGTPAEVLDPNSLLELFGARFETFLGGERPMTVLRLEER